MPSGWSELDGRDPPDLAASAAAALGSAGGEHDLASERILIHAPTGRDATLSCDILGKEGYLCQVCETCAVLTEEIGRGAGLALIGAECLDAESLPKLVARLERQPVWSDLPIVLLTRESEDGELVVRTLGPRANLTLLERPVWITNLRSSVRAAVRARRRQYEVRDLLVRLAESDRMKDEFLAMLGHELRNPLNAIATAAAILREEEGGELLGRQTRLIERQTRHLARMMDDLLDLSRLSQAKIELREAPIDLRDPVRGAVETIEMAGFGGERRIDVRLPDQPVPVVGDPLRLEQVVANLLQNAVKYTPEGGRVALALTVGEDEATVAVEDEGIGIPEHEIETVFAPFTRLGNGDGTQVGLQGGLGIGLYLARQLAELHTGRLEATSAGPGKGSEFRLVLPLRTDAGELGSADADGGAKADGEGRPSRDGTDALRVLLVEDNEEGREALVELLRIWGCEVVPAATGEEGVGCALGERPRLALIDIGLPDIDGYEVARRIRRELDGEACRLVALTGYGQPEDRRRALEAGFDEHMVKPVDTKRLTELLDSVR